MVDDSRQAGALEIQVTPEMVAAGQAVFELEGEGMANGWLGRVFVAMLGAHFCGYDATMKLYPFGPHGDVNGQHFI